MNKSLILYIYISYLKNNSDDKLVAQSVYYWYQKKTQILLKKELNNDKDININLKSIEVSIITY